MKKWLSLLRLAPAAFVAVGLANVDPDIGLVQIAAAIAGPLIFLSAVSAAGSLSLARRAEDRELLAASEDVAEPVLTDGEVNGLFGGGGRPVSWPTLLETRSRRSPGGSTDPAALGRSALPAGAAGRNMLLKKSEPAPPAAGHAVSKILDRRYG